MNKNLYREGKQLFELLDNFKTAIIILNLFIWPYIMADLLGIGIISTLLLLLWIVCKIYYERTQDNSFVHMNSTISMVIRALRRHPEINVVAHFKAIHYIVAHTLLALLMISIVTHSAGLYTNEGIIKWTMVLSAVFYISLSFLKIKNDNQVQAILLGYLQHTSIREILSIFSHYWDIINSQNIKLHPFIALAAVIAGIIAPLQQSLNLEQLSTIFIIYIASIGILIINQIYTCSKRGFLLLSGKTSIAIKILLHIIIPSILIYQLYTDPMGENVSIFQLNLAFLIGTGSVWLIMSDSIFQPKEKSRNLMPLIQL